MFPLFLLLAVMITAAALALVVFHVALTVADNRAELAEQRRMITVNRQYATHVNLAEVDKSNWLKFA